MTNVTTPTRPVPTGSSPSPLPARRFPLGTVRPLPGPLADSQRVAVRHLLALDPDRLLAPYREEAGLDSPSPRYGSWESGGMGGHIGGHALSAAAQLVAATGDDRLRSFAAALVDGLVRCQQAIGTGYVGGVPGGAALGEELRAGRVEAEAFSLNGRWVPLYNLHKTLAGLVDAARYLGSAPALAAAVAFARWWDDITAGLDDATLQQVLHAEFGGLGEAFAELAELTGDPAHTAAALRLVHAEVVDPLLAGRDDLDGKHANTQIPKLLACARLAEVRPDLGGAARRFWDDVVSRRTTVIGGNSVREHFHPARDFSPVVTDRQGPETCNTHNLQELSALLFEQTGDARLLDHYERALLNHVLSTQHPGHGGLVYFTPLRPAHYRVYSAPEVAMWCCVGSGLEAPSRHVDLALARRAAAGGEPEELLVNLWVPVRLEHQDLSAELTCDGPVPTAARLRVRATSRPLTVALRVPTWVESFEATGPDGTTTVAGPGERWLRLSWARDGETVVEVRMTSRPRTEPLPDGSGWTAFLDGPLVLAGRDDDSDLVGLVADDSRMGHVAAGPLRPLAASPVVGDDAVTRVPGAPGRWRLRTAVGDVRDLVPFSGLHDARYTVYWPTGPDPVARTAELVRLDETEDAAQVVDEVVAGEQQPEVEHGMTAARSRTGYRDGRHHREADPGGWFSYVLDDPSGEARELEVATLPDGPDGWSLEIDGVPVPDPARAGGQGLVRTRLDPAPGPRSVRVVAGADGTPSVTRVRLRRTTG